MKIGKIGAENFLGLGKAELNLSDYSGIVLIEGINKDSPTSVNNGAGKSSIFEIVGYGFQGTTRRGYSGDDVVNIFAKKNCHVFVEFESNGKKFRIDRYRKHSEFGSHLGLTDISGEVPAVLTMGTAKETQKLIDEIIGMSGLTLDKMLYFGQEDIKPFASLTDAELKSVFEESLALTYLSEYAALIKEEFSSKKLELTRLLTEVQRTEERMVNTSSLIDLTRENINSFNESKKRNIASIDEHIDSIKNSIEEAKKTDDEQIAILKSKVNDFIVHEERYNSLVELKRQLDSKIALVNSGSIKSSDRMVYIKSDVEKLSSEILRADFKIGKPCDLCKKEVLKEDIEPITSVLVGKRDGLIEEYKSHASELEKCSKELESLKTTESKLFAALAELETLKRIAQSAEKELLFKESSSIIDTYNKTIDDLNEKKKKEEIEVNPYILKLDSLFIDMNGLKEALSICNSDLIKVEQELKDLEIMLLAFGNSGIKNRIFDNVTPELNTQISKLMSTMDDIDIEISTMKVLKSGDIREKFEVKVDNKNGAASYKGNSGGEKQKINLCISLAFNMLMRKMTSNPINVLFLDEPFEALDSGSSEAAISLCKTISEGVVVFVISHNPEIKDLISNRILVEKKGGIARVVC